ncbi:hypothetical protein [Arenimonas alkanexedens]
MADGIIPSAQADIDFAEEALTRIEANLKIPLRKIMASDNSGEMIRAQAYAAIRVACHAMAEREFTADASGLAEARRHIDAVTDTQNVVPTILIEEKNFNVIKNYEGDQVRDYVKGVVNGLSLIKEGESPEMVALQIIGTGLVGFGGAFAFGLIRSLVAKEVLKVAVKAGLKAAGGVGAVVGVVAVILVELLLYLLHGNKKNFVGMIFNNTDTNLVVKDWRAGVGGADKGDLYMAWGHCSGFMEVHQDGDLSKPALQLPARSAPEEQTGRIIQGGIYSGGKNFGLKGAEGVFVMQPLGQTSPRLAVLFECPYFEDNGVNVAIDTTHKSARTYYDQLNGTRGLDRSVAGAGYKLRARVADARGGEALGIAVIDPG